MPLPTGHHVAFVLHIFVGSAEPLMKSREEGLALASISRSLKVRQKEKGQGESKWRFGGFLDLAAIY
jgi:hypothetical protein